MIALAFCLIQHRLRLRYEFDLLVFLSERERVGCQDHGVVVSAALTPNSGKRQPRIDRFRGLFQDFL
ncbi:MAG: hypothetical protein HC938_06125 [Nitrospira sp.]|nr:hypothetical protein [Nitrospira sp.]